ncbi:MAG TPA: hypothetical protein PKK44_09640 [Candidatus Hydrogenedentes bacterium]|jgi:hypothetical protein|nr:hypothetical protein [Candidatus Hydrogenedentota bacterium]HPV36101.1 hypothetical protein [Candidatus Hydrogenedentota bacterium]HPX39842.1 hypothetical protein [Candidatus Hydrogenedentota bacterium]HQK74878.1 hypothetical protein [Candidatus Hydrogenedentota bacterium]
MAITGKAFMRVSKATRLEISGHALERIAQHTGLQPTRALAQTLFHRSRQVKASQMWALGYRPGYWQRLAGGQKSWYFRFMLFGEELVAVVQEGALPGHYLWVTTYGATPQSDRYRWADIGLFAEAC